MRWRDWQLITILALLCWVAMGIALTSPAEQRLPKHQPTRTPLPTFESTKPALVASMILPTNTPPPTKAPIASATCTPTATPLIPTSTPTASPTQATATPETRTITHTVQRGENLLGIAQRYGTTVQAIVEANQLPNPDLIFIGQMLVIPLPSEPSSTPTPAS